MVWAKGHPFNMKWGWGNLPKAPRARTVGTPARRGQSQGRGRSVISAFQKVSTVQRKYVDTTTNIFGAAAAIGAITLVNATTQGTGNSGRVGRIATIKSVQGRYTLTLSGGAASVNPPAHVRILVVYDKETNGVAPTVANVLQTDTVVSPMNMENSQRYIVLAESGLLENIGAGAVGIANQPTAQYRFEFYKKCNLALEWNTGNAGTVADINYGAIWIVAYCVNGGAAVPVIYEQTGYTRVRFTDA